VFKLIKIILGIALVAAAAYFLFIGGSSQSSNKISNLSGQGVMMLASTTEQNITNQAQGVFYGITSQIKVEANNIVASATQQAKNYLFDMFKSAVESGVNSLGEKVGVNNLGGSSATTTP
jgi:L-asparagine transporter-like permease